MGFSAAAHELRYGLAESMGYPYLLYDQSGAINGGLLYDIGRRIAREANAKLVVVPIARQRVDSYLLSGEVDIVCFHSPQWSEVANQLTWSIPNLPQVERVVTLKGNVLTGDINKDFAGKKVSTQLGYHYSSLQGLIDSGQLKRVDDVKVNLLFKSLELKLTDMLISSEGEIQGYLHERPNASEQYEISKTAFTITPTQCAISPRSRFTKTEIDRALARLLKRGDFDAMAKLYGLSMH